MTARETETSTAVGSFDCPHHGFIAPLRFLNVFIGTLGVNVGTVANFIRWRGNENRRKRHSVDDLGLGAIEVRDESHVEVPLIFYLKRLNARRD